MENRLKQRRVSFSDPPSQEQEEVVSTTRDEEHGTAETLDTQKMKEGPTQTTRRKQESISRRPSYATSNHGEAVPVRLPNAVESPRPILPLVEYQKKKGSSIPLQHNDFKTTAESWKNAKIDNIQKRCEKIKFKILLWECEREMQAKLHMDKKKSNLEHKRGRGILHYQNKIAVISRIAEGARTKLEERRRKEESKVREKANILRKTGRVPLNFLCFNC